MNHTDIVFARIWADPENAAFAEEMRLHADVIEIMLSDGTSGGLSRENEDET